MKPRTDEPTSGEGAPIADRWIARADERSPEAQAGALLRQALQREPIEAGRLAAIRSRLRRTVQRPRRHWALRLAIAVGLVLSGGALTAAGQRYFRVFVPEKAAPFAPAPSQPHAARVRIARAPVSLPVPPPEIPAPADVPRLPEPAPVERRASAPRPADVAPTGVTPAPFAPVEAPPSALAQESKLLTEALRRLRQDDDPAGALALLDEHDRRFAAGTLAPEAALARIEALLRLRRTGDALALLDRAAPAPAGTGRDLLIARAELRAAAGRCAAASTDFDRLLRADRPLDAITERALWGRASCRAPGDGAGARRDLHDYLTIFPRGRFAAEARAALGE